MQNLAAYTLCLIIYLFAATAGAQGINQHHYSKLLVPKDTQIEIETDSIYIDTLIMEDESILRFETSSVLIIEHAFIGKECLWDGSGMGSMEAGEDGEPGRSISTVLVIESLGSLSVVTDGGRGGDGKNGTAGSSGMNGSDFADGGDGSNGLDGGNGGDAGDIKFHYSSQKFLPKFNEDGDHAIFFSNKGGERGNGGEGGRGGKPGQPVAERDNVKNRTITVGNAGKPGMNGLRGNPGTNGKPGEFILKRF